MLNNNLNLDLICEGDCVIIKLKERPIGLEYYGIVIKIDAKSVYIVGKQLSWVLTGDLILDQMDLYISSIEDIRLYTYDDARHARETARRLLSREDEP